MPSKNYYKLRRFQVLTYHKTSYVVYGHGDWWQHLWGSCGYYHGRLPDSPVFDSVEEATGWLKEKVSAGEYKEKMIFPGHHAGRLKCSRGCDDRIVSDMSFRQLAKE